MGSEAEDLNYGLYKDAPKTLKPPLKWAGGKRWLVPHLRALYSNSKKQRLVEPFVGGMAVTLGLHPKTALLNDVNPHLINFYQTLKKKLKISVEMENEREFFFEKRDLFNKLIRQEKFETKKAAELFYYLNRTAFNGLCRFNSKGEFNVPFGKYAKINYVRDFSEYVGQFKNWEFQFGDFEKLKIKSSDFLYVDPPYDVEFTKYSKDDFTWDDQVRLVDWLKKQKCQIVASNQATPRIVKLYEKNGFKVKKLSGPRRIACNGDRAPAEEILAVKNI